MKTYWLFSLCVALIFTACSKSNNNLTNNPLGISAAINGKVTSFGANIRVDTTSSEIDITASTDSLGGYPVLEFSVIIPSGPVKAGIYPDISLAGLNAPTATLRYIIAPDNTSFGPIFFQSIDDSVIVNSISQATISGTFHGHATYKSFSGPMNTEHDSVIAITNGTFNIKR